MHLPTFSCVTALLLALVFLLTVFVTWYSRVWSSALPPGPTPLPFVGNVHQIAWKGANNLQETLVAWGKQYGDIYSIFIGGEQGLVLSSYDAIKEAFSMQLLSGRPNNLVKDIVAENSGLLYVDGETWKEQRRFTLSRLKDLGFGKTKFEDKILEEIVLMFEILGEQNGRPFDSQYLVTCSVSNVITSIVWGKRYDYSDRRIQGFIKTVNDATISLHGASGWDAMLPILRHLPGDLMGANTIVSTMERIKTFLREIVEEHKAAFDSTCVADFVDLYLQQIEIHADDKETSFTEHQLISLLRDLYVAGLETTSTTLRWAFLFLARNPDIQTNARKEVHNVIGKERLPSYRDKTSLPYLEAVITETHRLGRVVPLAAFHAPLENTIFRGYTIPKGTTIMANMAAIFLNEELFPNPYAFNPERYLDANIDGERILRRSLMEKVIPFSIGRRVCLGESLAKMELYLYMATILQRFTISIPDGAQKQPVIGIQGVTYLPQPHTLCFFKN